MKAITIYYTPDDFGPEKVIIVYDPRTKMQGYLKGVEKYPAEA